MHSYFTVIREGLGFQQAYAAFKMGQCVKRSGSRVVYEPCTSMDMDKMKFSAADILATDWQECGINWDLQDKLYDVRDYVEEAGLVVDTRFYDLDKMDIGQIFSYIAENELDVYTEYDILMMLKKEGYKFGDKRTDIKYETDTDLAR